MHVVGQQCQVGIIGPQPKGTQQAPQISKLFESQSSPDIISLTIGTNDTEIFGLVRQCRIKKCDTAEHTLLIDQKLESLDDNLTQVLDKIQLQYGARTPQTAITGYYQMLSGE